MSFRALNTGIINSMPIIAFLVIYLFSNMFGALVLLYQLDPFYSVFVYHSGISLPVTLDPEQMRTFWLIAIGAPVVMSVAFFAVFLPVSNKLGNTGPGGRDLDPPFSFVLLLFMLLACFGAYSIYRAGGFEALETWGNYADLVESRWKLYATLSFFEFANLYQFVPVAGIMALLVGIKMGGRARTIGVLCALIGICIGIFIYQKKVVVTSMILTVSSLIIYSYFVSPKRVARLIGFAAVSALSLIAVFFIASVVPTLTSQTSAVGNSANTTQDVEFVKKWREETAHDLARSAKEKKAAKSGKLAAQDAPDEALSIPDPEALKKAAAEAAKLAAQNPNINVPLFVSLNNLTMRTSVPAVYYIAVFPNLHPYFPLDLGQDILGFGEMPNDNRVVWKQMYPDMPGLVAAPFNFVLYSQGGLVVAYVVSAFVGMIVGLMWAVILGFQGAMALRAALGAVIVVGTMHLSLDALRNTIIVSYGFTWGLVPLVVFLIPGGLSAWRRKTRKGVIARGD